MCITYMSSIYSIFLLCIESNALEKSTNSCVALRFFLTPLMDYQNLWGYPVIPPKAILIFFLRIFSISGWIQLRISALKTLAAIAVMPL